MPYILNKTNGSIVTTVQDASIDRTTDLVFVGKNYAGYGEIQNENFLKLLENFANTTEPPKKIEGQLWYDSSNKVLNVFDSVYWKPIANIEIATSDPSTTTSPSVGNLWFDTSSNQLKVWNGTEYVLIGPPTGSDLKAQWRGDFEYDAASSLPVYNIKAVIGVDNEVVAIASAETFDMPETLPALAESPLYPARITPEGGNPGFTRIIRGITLEGAVSTSTYGVAYGSSRKEVTGLSTSSFFWGTAGEAIQSLYATTATTAVGLTPEYTNENALFSVPFVNTSTTRVYYDNDSSNGIRYNPSSGILYTIASSALYADIAERYEADAVYEPGTVLMLGGEKEVTLAILHATTAVAGVVSKNPAYMMNSEAGSDETHPFIALKGRVPCKICGPVKKGDLLVASGYKAGYASKKQDHDSPNAVIGRALENFEGPFGVIEIKV